MSRRAGAATPSPHVLICAISHLMFPNISDALKKGGKIVGIERRIA